MRLLSQSQLVDGSPYRHLAYLAATHIEPERISHVAGWVVMATGVGVFLASRVSTWFRRKGASGGARGGKTRSGEIAAAVCLIGGVALLGIAYNIGRRVPDHGLRNSQSNARDVQWRIRSREKEGKPVVDPSSDPEIGRLLVDGWGTPMRAIMSPPQAPGGAVMTLIISAGDDMTFGTADDLRFEDEPAASN